jgi:hypothetical protein
MITIAASGCVTVVLALLLALGVVALPLVPIAASLASSADNTQMTSEASFNQTVTPIVATNNAVETYIAETATAEPGTPVACNDCGGGMVYVSPTLTPTVTPIQ